MIAEEDRIKHPLYIKFQKKYFARKENKRDGKTRFIQLSHLEKLEFCRLQKLEVEEDYEKIKYKIKTR